MTTDEVNMQIVRSGKDVVILVDGKIAAHEYVDFSPYQLMQKIEKLLGFEDD